MAKKKILVLQDQIERLCRMGLKCRVIGGKGGVVLVEADEHEETDGAPELVSSTESELE